MTLYQVYGRAGAVASALDHYNKEYGYLKTKENLHLLNDALCTHPRSAVRPLYGLPALLAA